jgi:hypothetical protein
MIFSSGLATDNTSTEDKVKNLKRFSRAISHDPLFLIPAFYDFFEIPDEMVQEDRRHRVSEISFRPTEEMLRGSMMGSSKQHSKTLANALGGNWSDYRHETIDKYCNFFRIYLVDSIFNKDNHHHIFSFQIEGALDNGISYTIDKRYSDFVTLVEMMKSLTKARPPPLPPKIMVVKGDKNIEDRGL